MIMEQQPEKKVNYVFLPDTASVMALYEVVHGASIRCTIAPTPREADHCCGVCLIFEDDTMQNKIRELAEAHAIPIDAFWSAIRSQRS